MKLADPSLPRLPSAKLAHGPSARSRYAYKRHGILRTALRQLEVERDQVDRQMGALRAALDSASALPKVSRRPRTMSAAARRAVSRRMKARTGRNVRLEKQGKSKAAKKVS